MTGQTLGGGIDALHSVGAAGEVGFQNSWGNRVGNSLRYWKDPSNLLLFVTSAFLDGSTKSADTVFTLPVGFRPSAQCYGIGSGQPAAYNSPIQLEVIIGLDGTYQVLNANEGSPSSAQVNYVIAPGFICPLV